MLYVSPLFAVTQICCPYKIFLPESHFVRLFRVGHLLFSFSICDRTTSQCTNNADPLVVFTHPFISFLYTELMQLSFQSLGTSSPVMNLLNNSVIRFINVSRPFFISSIENFRVQRSSYSSIPLNIMLFYVGISIPTRLLTDSNTKQVTILVT